MSSINEKLGLAPKSRTRQATHGSGLVSAARCPECTGRHVVEHSFYDSAHRRNTTRRLCGACGHVWYPGEVRQ